MAAMKNLIICATHFKIIVPRQDPGVNHTRAFGSHCCIDIGPDEAETQFCIIANCELKVFKKIK